MLSPRAKQAFSDFYKTAAEAPALSQRESVLVRLAAAMALGCSP
jgi:hypothetical protein